MVSPSGKRVLVAGGVGIDTIVRVPSLPLAMAGPVVDSNGAGDAFSSAFLHAWFAGQPLDACMRTGAIGGASACSLHGTAERSLDLATLARHAAPGPAH